MDSYCVDETRVSVWMAMAEHFLDTETRHEIPFTALACVRAGFSVEEAHAIWACEVAPAVRFNLFLVAGEWGGWDRDWLVERIGTPRPGLARRIHCAAHRCMRSGDWVAIERCMLLLLDAPESEREARSRDLAWLARHHFDCGADALDPGACEARARLERLIETALHCFAPVTLRSETLPASRRVRNALIASGSSTMAPHTGGPP